jgi:hypothetical protein
MHVPISDIAPGVEKNEMPEQHGHQVDPPLIDEQSLIERNQAVSRQVSRPPVKKWQSIRAHSDKSEVVDACLQDHHVVRQAVVIRKRLGDMRREND